MFNILLDDILEMKFWYTCGNDRALNVRHWQVTDVTPGAGVLTSLAAANQLFLIFDGLLAPCMSTDSTFDAVSLQRLTPLPKTVMTLSTEAAVPGAEVPAVLPRQVAGLISLYTALAGPSHRGRFYMPYPDEGANEAQGKPTAAYIVDLQSLADALILPRIMAAAVGNMTFTPCIVHRAGGQVDFITASVARPTWATQRRRQNGRF